MARSKLRSPLGHLKRRNFGCDACCICLTAKQPRSWSEAKPLRRDRLPHPSTTGPALQSSERLNQQSCRAFKATDPGQEKFYWCPPASTYTKGRCLRTSAFLRSIAQIGNAWRMNQRCWQPLWHRVAPRSLRLAPPRESAFPGGGPAPGRSRPKLSAFLESRYVCEIRGRFVLIAERTGPSSAGA